MIVFKTKMKRIFLLCIAALAFGVVVYGVRIINSIRLKIIFNQLNSF